MSGWVSDGEGGGASLSHEPVPITVAAGEDILLEGAYGEEVYLIESGQVEIWSLRAGSRYVLDRLGPGMIFGELAAISGNPRSASVTALVPTRLAVLTGAQLRERLDSSDTIVKLLVDVLLRRVHSERRCGEAYAAGATPPHTRHALEKIRWELRLAYALEHDQLALHYQPIVALGTGALAGVEALLRWRYPQEGALSPQQMVALAEETRLIQALDRWVIERACRDLRTLQQHHPRSEALFVTINLSAHDVGSEEILEILEAARVRHGLAAHHIKLEVTETVLVQAVDARPWIARCQAHGFRVVLDDFGTGYSSLSYLLHLHADTLKIDQAFVRPLLESPRARAIVEGILAMAGALDMDVVAEGIDSAALADALAAMGCTLGQGFHLSRPAALADLLAGLDAARPSAR